MSSLKINRLYKDFGKSSLLKDISFECKTGQILGVFGKNGTGKSTLLKIIFGTMNTKTIQLQIDAKIMKPKDVIKSKRIAYLPQDTFLPKRLKVRDIIPIFFHDGKKQDSIFYAPKISTFEKKKIGNLSMGELRYLELLLIGNLEHSFLMLDEPFSMIEPLYKEIIKKKLITLKEKKGIIITDHYYSDVIEITDYNFLIKDGTKIDINSLNDLEKHGYLN